MKKLIIILVALLMSISSFAQQGINYKAVIKDSNGNVVANDIINVRFSIIKDTGPTIVYAEDHTNVMTDANGIMILNIGEGTPTTNTYANIAWGSDTHSLKTEIDIEQDATFENMGTTIFKTVPYAIQAIRASEADNVTGLEQITEGSNTGWRLKDRNSDFYGVIGGNAVDLSISDISSTSGATGNGSFAANYRTSAEGASASALGNSTIAIANNSLAIGQFNKEDGNGLFVIGNGIDDLNRNNALSLFLNNSFVVGSYQLNDDPGINTDDTRFFFNKPKGAFRAGFANGTQWDDSQIGDYSTAFGFVTTASGARSTALGSGTKASGFASTAIGNYNKEVLDAYFIIGNGNDDVTRKNALVVKSNGDLIVGSSQLDDDNTTSNDNAKVFFNKAKGAFRAGLVDATYWDDSEVGSYSVSMGLNTKAKGQNSFAMGGNSNAIGKDAVAMGGIANANGQNAISIGNQTTANGITSVALGAGTTANGYYSTAMNLETTADALGSTAIGINNIGGGDPFNWVETDPIFEIGNATKAGDGSWIPRNALTVLKNGTITAPSLTNTLIDNAGDKALVTKEYMDANGAGLEAIDEGNGIGWRLKGTNPAYYGNIGFNAVDLSINNVESTTYGATGVGSVAMGFKTTASSDISTAMGISTKASNYASTAMGWLTIASGDVSTAMGLDTTASGDLSTAMGYSTTASGDYSIAMGSGTTALGNYSTSMGRSTLASAEASTVIGKYNVSDLDGLFIIGNGTGISAAQKNNALIVRTNGDAQFDGKIQHTSTGSANQGKRIKN